MKKTPHWKRDESYAHAMARADKDGQKLFRRLEEALGEAMTGDPTCTRNITLALKLTSLLGCGDDMTMFKVVCDSGEVRYPLLPKGMFPESGAWTEYSRAGQVIRRGGSY